MYAHLTGTIEGLGPDHLVLGVHGVGYLLHASARTLGSVQPGRSLRLLTHLQVREDALTLYGFSEPAEHAMFLRLLGVSGVGPRLALSLLSTFSPPQIAAAISANQPATLARASGVGKKMAEKIIVELKDKLGSLPTADGAVVQAGGTLGDVISALTNLGYAPKVAEQSAAAAQSAHPSGTFHEWFRTALQHAAKG